MEAKVKQLGSKELADYLRQERISLLRDPDELTGFSKWIFLEEVRCLNDGGFQIGGGLRTSVSFPSKTIHSLMQTYFEIFNIKMSKVRNVFAIEKFIVIFKMHK